MQAASQGAQLGARAAGVGTVSTPPRSLPMSRKSKGVGKAVDVISVICFMQSHLSLAKLRDHNQGSGVHDEQRGKKQQTNKLQVHPRFFATCCSCAIVSVSLSFKPLHSARTRASRPDDNHDNDDDDDADILIIDFDCV